MKQSRIPRMAQVIINTGNVANDGLGTPLRNAFDDVNTNFTQLFNAGPSGSNIVIANNTVFVTNTNGNLNLATNGVGSIVPKANFVPDIPNVRSIGAGTNRFNTIYSQYVNANTGTFAGNVYVAGNLQVTGNVVTVDYSNLSVANVSITLATGSANAAQATGGGILIPIANANFTYNYSSNRWDSTLPISAPSFIGDGSLLTNVVSVIDANALVGNTLATGVNYSNLQSFGTVSAISASGNISTTGNVYANVFVGNIVNANILRGDGGNISNINAAAIVGSIPYSLYANSAQTANVAALATQAVNSQTAILAQTANLAIYASAAGTATRATSAVQADNANAAIVAGLAYQLASTANISVAGNISTDGYFFGNGAYITGISVVVNASNITFSNTTISTVDTLEPIVIKTYDTANSLTNLWAFEPNGTLSAAGNIIVNNNLLFPGNAAVTTTIPGNIISNVNVVALTNGINGDGWSNYLALDSNGNVHIAKNSNNTSGSLIWDGGGSSIYESTTDGLIIASFAQYATIASALTVQGNAFANNFSTIGNVYAVNAISDNVIANTGTFTNNVSINSNLSVTGDINASYYFGNGSYLTGVIPVTGNIGFIDDTIYDINGPTLNNSDLSHGATAGLVIPANGNTQPATLTNIYGNVVLGASLTGAGGISNWTFDGTGNLTAPGDISAIGNVAGNYILGNGAFLSGVITSVANINNGTSNVSIYTADANVTVAVSGVGNVAVFTPQGLNLSGNVSVSGNTNVGNLLTTGLLSATGNVTSGNLLTTGLISATSTITSADNISGGNLLTTGLVSSTGNVTGGNLLTAGLMSSSGNAIHGNITTDGLVTATGNVTGGNLLTAGLMSSTGNVTGGNILTSGQISATANITTAGYFVGTFAGSISGNVTAAGTNTQVQFNSSGNLAATSGFTFNVLGNILSVTGNIAGANLLTAGFVSATSNITGGNILTAGLISATSTITSAANIAGGNIKTVGVISATGNITGNYYFGNGINLTGLANITFGSTPPANAIIGDTWIDSTTGIQYVYFNDITGNIWAEMEAQTAYASVGYANLTTNTLNTQVLYNASNAIVGSDNLTFDGTTLSAQGVTVGGSLQVSANSIISNTANGNLIINTTGTNAYINLLGGFTVNSYGGNRLIQTLNDTINFYTPILNSTDSAVDIIGSLDGNTLSTQTTGIMLHITGQPTLPSRIYNDAANTYAAYIGRAYNGNVNAPTQILANTVVSRIGANPYGNAGFSQLSTTRIDMVTTENQTTTNQGSQINFWSTPTGSNTIVQTATLNSTALSVSGNVVSLGIVNSRNFINNITTTVSSAANVTLTALSNYNQVITGTAAQNFFLPNATTLLTGTTFLFNVNSSQPTYIYYHDATLLATVPAGGLIEFTLLSNGTANGTWDRHSGIPSYASWGSSALAMGGANITGGTNISVTGIVSATGNVIGGNVRASTVNTIPTLYTNLIAVAGSRAFITDGNLIASGNFGNQVSGGGSNTVPVWSNGTNWYIG